MLFDQSKVFEGATLSWCDRIVGEFFLSRWTPSSALLGGTAGFRSNGDPVNYPLLQLNCEDVKMLFSSAGDRWWGLVEDSGTSIVCDEVNNQTGTDSNLFHCIIPLGSGSFGTVLLAQSRLHPTRFFAAKGLTQLLQSSLMAEHEIPGGKQDMMEVLRQIVHGEVYETSQQHPALCNFVRETQVTLSLPSHPHIARCYGIVFATSPVKDERRIMHSVSSSRLPSPTISSAYMLMELGTGGTLGDFFRRYKEYLAEEHLICLISQLLKGLVCMHKNGVLHRDIKPSNVLVRRRSSSAWESDTELFFVDFGIAAVVGDANCETERTLIGSGAYSPPEIARYWGYRRQCPYSYASDIWSMGAIFYVLLTCGASKVEDGMSAVFLDGLLPTPAAVASFQLRVARGEYPSLMELKKIPLVSNETLSLLRQHLAYQRTKNVTFGNNNSEIDYTRYTTVLDGKMEIEGTVKGDWPEWALTVGAQVMARNLQRRQFSDDFLKLIDLMMIANPADRPTAEKLLLEFPIFAIRMPWWEKALDRTLRRIEEGEEDVLLDVCVGESDEEEEEDEEEIAVMRRTMMPLILPAENDGYVPHNIIHWWHLDFTKGEPDYRKWFSITSLLGCLLDALRRLRGFEIDSDSGTNERKPVTLYSPTALHFVERVFDRVNSSDISVGACCDGPLLKELEARNLNSNFFIHVQIKIYVTPEADKIHLSSTWCDEYDIADEEEMSRHAMEVLVATTYAYLNRRQEGVPLEAALQALDWVSWHIGKNEIDSNGKRERCFTLEYLAAAPREVESQFFGKKITGDITSVFRIWRANLDDALRCSLRDTSTTISTSTTSITASTAVANPQTDKSHYNEFLKESMKGVLGILNSAEVELQKKQVVSEEDQGLLQGLLVQQFCVRQPPSVKACMRVFEDMADDSHSASLLVEEWIRNSIFNTEGSMVLLPENSI
ncbi:putative serine/threonine protein kinase [Trypanosoma theileri]|uniref:Putative serine/threonine protein kinase n=1 Tax=Trypanosoma theileri TaxID=67003 RepID=A0A1X0P7E2_9TRYP|nr:putative serine/threonine protein kinase [Trypanosoma theileri]ORC92854.1 putative serine/threonine protein kinase [Trypanosoma theileri]